jgi:tetratricopeptide (TPR) repeat protein
VQMTEASPDATILLRSGEVEIARWQDDLPAGKIGMYSTQLADNADLEVQIVQNGQVVLRYAPSEIVPAPEPDVATEPPLPQDVHSNDELYLTGVHLEQYRHPTRDPEEYWLEAVRRDAGDSRCNHALGRFHMRRGELQVAEAYLRTSLARMTRRNPNPTDGEPHYNLGRVLLLQGRVSEAYAAFYKSTWVAAWRGPGYQRVAEIDMCRGEWQKALDHLDHSLVAEAENLGALNLKVFALRKAGLSQQADALLQSIRELDPLDVTSRFLQSGAAPADAQQQIDLALDLLRAGLAGDAERVLRQPAAADCSGGNTMRLYLLGEVLAAQARFDEARDVASQAAVSDPAYVFPHRLEEMLILERAIAGNPTDAQARFFLGNLLFDRRRHKEAADLWEQSVALDPANAVAWRNLGIARFNALHDAEGAAEAFAHARSAAPDDARLLYEQDQLRKRTGTSLEARLSDLRQNFSLVRRRDDLTAEFVSLLTSNNDPAEALRLLQGRRFGPWEGGEGQVLGEYVRANLRLALNRLKAHDPSAALALLHNALRPPASLGEARHLLANLSTIDFWMGVAASTLGRTADAKEAWESAARQKGDFQQMQVQAISEMTYWSGLSLARLGRQAEAEELFRAIDAHARRLKQETPKIDYFATSLPTLLLFHEDLQKTQTVTACFLRAQAQLGLGHRAAGEALLHEVLALNGSHTGAIDMLHMLSLGVL